MSLYMIKSHNVTSCGDEVTEFVVEAKSRNEAFDEVERLLDSTDGSRCESSNDCADCRCRCPCQYSCCKLRPPMAPSGEERERLGDLVIRFADTKPYVIFAKRHKPKRL